MSISETTVTRIVDAGERADDLVRRIGRMSRDAEPALSRPLGWLVLGLALAAVAAASIRHLRRPGAA
jgi:hypothetical protein